MGSEESKDGETIYALVDYQDPYVQPLILAALKKRLASSTFELILSINHLPSPSSRLLQFVQYESIDFDHLMHHSSTSLANAYVIRKALIRKHYLSTTISNHITKYPDSVLKTHVKPSVEFEVDYAEFLDDALVEAWELKESWARNDALEEQGDDGNKRREWWILKPGMSERGQGIRLFSNEQELTDIFEEWDPESDDDEEERGAQGDDEDGQEDEEKGEAKEQGNGIITSQLRHFIAQPYIHPPLLLPPPNSPSNSSHRLRKFHIRTYVLATGALQVYVYRSMLALFAARAYVPPWDPVLLSDRDAAMKAHLTNTCLRDSGDGDGSVGLFWSLPATLPMQPDHLRGGATPLPSARHKNWKDDVFNAICAITGAAFDAAARGMSIHFQPLPNAFEIFGLDFMIGVEPDGGLRTWLLEVNAFPDFRQTGDACKDVVAGLFEGVVDVGVAPFFGVRAVSSEGEENTDEGRTEMVRVLDVDLGRR